MKEITAVDAAHSLFQLQEILIECESVNRVSTFFDSGSNVNLIRESFAKRAGLKGQPVLESLYMTGGQVTEWKTKDYYIPLVDRGGKVHKVMAYSIGIITSPMEDVDLRPALKEFPELKKDYIKIARPTGDVDFLLGIQDAHLHPYLTNQASIARGNFVC